MILSRKFWVVKCKMGKIWTKHEFLVVISFCLQTTTKTRKIHSILLYIYLCVILSISIYSEYSLLNRASCWKICRKINEKLRKTPQMLWRTTFVLLHWFPPRNRNRTNMLHSQIYYINMLYEVKRSQLNITYRPPRK